MQKKTLIAIACTLLAVSAADAQQGVAGAAKLQQVVKKHFTFHLAGINMDKLLPEVEKVIYSCEVYGEFVPSQGRPNVGSSGNQEFPVTVVNGEGSLHTGPITISFDARQGQHPSNARTWRCGLGLMTRDGRAGPVPTGSDTCEPPDLIWRCPRAGTSPVGFVEGTF
jgi:hypothetical protein